jgi:hypothetical protein
MKKLGQDNFYFHALHTLIPVRRRHPRWGLNVSVVREATQTTAPTHKKGSRSIQTITQGIMNVGRGGGGGDAKRALAAQGKRITWWAFAIRENQMEWGVEM